MSSAIEIDRSQGNLIVVRFLHGPTDEEFEQYLADYTPVLLGQARMGVVYVTGPSMPLTPPRQARLQTRFMKAYRAEIEARVVGIAFALATPLMRGVLRGILVLQSIPCPHTVVATESEGVSWVKARLWTDNVRRTTEPLR